MLQVASDAIPPKEHANALIVRGWPGQPAADDLTRQAAAGDKEALSRVEFLACGVRYARENLTLYRKWKAKAPDYVAERERFYRFVKAEAEADPVAMCPKWIVTGFYKLPYMNEPR
jgi:hypothetical protein